MAIIATHIRDLNVNDSCARGQDIITKSTNNSQLPGNTEPLAAFVGAQASLVAAHAACIANRQEGERLRTVRDAALVEWRATIGILAAATQAIAKGHAAKMQSGGFDVRAPGSPTQPVEQIEGVKVRFNGLEGHSDIAWAADDNADSYVLECSPDPIGAGTYKYVATVAEAGYSGNGATPGQKCWYRVAGVNRLGQGPWSVPALRPVM